MPHQVLEELKDAVLNFNEAATEVAKRTIDKDLKPEILKRKVGMKMLGLELIDTVRML